jgi:hypothetical protein
MTTAKKPVTRKVFSRPAAYGVRAELAVTLHPGGTLSIRESGRKASSELFIDLGELYVMLVRRKAASVKRDRKLAKKKF